jgi:hypothetical protein
MFLRENYMSGFFVEQLTIFTAKPPGARLMYRMCNEFLHPLAISVPSEDSINILMSGDVASSPVCNYLFKTLHPIEEDGLELFE